jgi:hypothetical protein
MTRNANAISLAVLLAACLLSAGCPKKYEHKELGLEGPVAKAVAARLADLQKAAGDEAALKAAITAQLDEDLSANSSLVARCQAALTALAKAKDARLVRLDRFGSVYRAGFSFTDPESGHAKETFFLMTDDANPRWIRPN